MATFSERYGYKPVRAALGQYESMDEGLRVAIWNFLYQNYMHGDANDITQEIRVNVIGEPLDLVEGTRANIVKLRQWYAVLPWNDVYDLLEYCVRHPIYRTRGFYRVTPPPFSEVSESINSLLDKHGATYKLVNGLVVPVSNREEVADVEEAASSNDYITKAIELLANRENPDYENVIKESISAVEYEVRRATGEDVARGLEKLAIHSQLAQAWKNMYNWASDEPGVRHPNTGDSRIGIAEARYVLVAASAFVNYLKLKSQP